MGGRAKPAAAMVAAAALALVAARTAQGGPPPRVGDPFILRDDAQGRYLLYKGQTPRVSVWASTNLVDWARLENPAFVSPASLDCAAIWAPEVRRFRDGKYYMFATVLTHQQDADCIESMEPGWTPDAAHRRRRLGTWVFRADAPEGPFEVWSEGPVTPKDWAALDGTAFSEGGRPYMVFCHEWTQVRDGRMDAVEMSKDLKRAAGEPFVLFRASELYPPGGSWRDYCTDGPWMHRAKDGSLFMLWSTYDGGSYCIVSAKSASGKLAGPWSGHKIVRRGQSGHAMVFRTFDGRTAVAFHSPNNGEERRLRIHERLETPDSLEIGEWIGGEK